MPRTNPARRTSLTDAGIALLAREGAHGLTHRAVEREAGVPAGTAGNYFRSREALLVATAERVVALHLEDMSRIHREVDLGSSVRDPVAELIAVSLMDAATRARERYLATFALQLEARRWPPLAAALTRLDAAAVEFTLGEHASLGLAVSSEDVGILMTLYGGALFVLVSGPEDVSMETVRDIAEAIVRGVRARASS